MGRWAARFTWTVWFGSGVEERRGRARFQRIYADLIG